MGPASTCRVAARVRELATGQPMLEQITEAILRACDTRMEKREFAGPIRKSPAAYRALLERRQIPIDSASLTNCSLKSGCAMLINASARCQVDLALNCAQPNSVTT